MDKQNSSYRSSVGIIVINKDKHIFSGYRGDHLSHPWQCPQGGIDPDEAPEVSMWRELYEEIGITKDKADLLAQTDDWYFYDFPDEVLKINQQQFKHSSYQGQKQKWFLLDFLGHDSDFDLNIHEAEFTKWAWFNRQDVIDQIVPFKKRVYEDVFDYFNL